MLVLKRGTNMKKFWFILNIILLITWMGVIFNFSNDNGSQSSSKSERLLIKIVETFKHEELTFDEKEKLNNKYGLLIRKMAHMFSYFILSILAYLLLSQIYGLKPVTIIYTLIFCFIYACTDEIHQAFIPDRGPSIIDVLIDTCGSLVFLLIPILILLKRKIVTNK